MIAAAADNWIGLGLALVAVVYLVIVLAHPGAVLMSWQDVLEAGALVVLLAITVPALGRYIAAVYGSTGRRVGARRPGVQPHRTDALPHRVGVDARREQRWNVYAISLLAFSLVSVLVLYAMLRLQGSLPFNPTDRAGVGADRCVQHRGQLRHQHQLAVVLRRGGDEPPHPDGRPRGAELRVGRRGLSP